MLVKFTRSKAQREAGISASIKPLFTAQRVKFKSTNSVNLTWLEGQGIDIESNEEYLIDVTESKVTYPRANGVMVTEFQLTVTKAESSKFQKLNEMKLNTLIEKGVDLDYDKDAVTFASPLTVVSNGNGNEGQKSFNNPKVETKTQLTETEYQAKLAELGSDTEAIAAFESKHEVII